MPVKTINQYSLMRDRRFLPYFIVQFLGAFNDNLMKTVVAVMIAYGLWDIGGRDPAVLIAIGSGLFILPFVLLCPIAGVLCDKYDKDRIIRIVKAVEVLIAISAIAALLSGDLFFAFFILLCLGAQSAFFSPAKFSILPALLKKNELIGGNAFVTSGTYIAILGGTISGTFFALLEHGKYYAAALILTCAVVGYIASLFIPLAKAPSPKSKVSFNIPLQMWRVFRSALEQKTSVLVAIIGVAWFYFVAATIHAQFPNFTKITLGADNMVLLAFMVIFSLGIGVGGLLNNMLLKSKIDTKYVPFAALAIVVFGIDVYLTATRFPRPTGGLLTFSEFIAIPEGIRLAGATFLQAVSCGFYVVPLRAVVQARTQIKVKAKVIASSNLLEALFILLSAVFSGVLLVSGVSIEGLYGLVSILTLVMVAVFYQTRNSD